MPTRSSCRSVTTFVENAALCFGLGRDESLRLTLAAEEVFIHLCRVVMPSGGPLGIRCSNGGYYAQADFSFPTDAFDMRAFNLTATILAQDDADLDAMGLVIASRSVDRFSLNREKGRDLRLTLIKEKAYPMPPEIQPATARPLAKWSLRPPNPEEVKFISQLSTSYYDAWALSGILFHPAKLGDMIRAGDYKSLAAVGSGGEIAGAVFWHQVGDNMVECFGPYVFNQGPESNIPEELLEGCIGAVAKTQALGIINIRPTPEFPRSHFELLGTFDAYAQDGACVPVEAWFRLLHEDMGAASLGPSQDRGVSSPRVLKAGAPERDQGRATLGRHLVPAFRTLRRIRPHSGARDAAVDVARRGCRRKYQPPCKASARRKASSIFISQSISGRHGRPFLFPAFSRAGSNRVLCSPMRAKGTWSSFSFEGKTRDNRPAAGKTRSRLHQALRSLYTKQAG